MRFAAVCAVMALQGCAGMASGPVDFKFPTQQQFEEATRHVRSDVVQQRAGTPTTINMQQFTPQATHTGRFGSPVMTVTGQYATPCQYSYNGQLFVRLFVGGCPSQIPVQ